MHPKVDSSGGDEKVKGRGKIRKSITISWEINKEKN